MCKDYSKVSDAELNIEVAKIQYPTDQCVTPYTHRPDAYIYHRNNLHTSKDYCNNPADAWPIILANKISVVAARDEWLCVPYDLVIDGWTSDEVDAIYSSKGFSDANPLRAAMIVFLMMQESQNG